MKYKLYAIIALFLITSACSDYFDVSPKTDAKAEDLFQNEQGFNDVLIGVYTLMTTKQLYGDLLSYSFLDVLAQYYTTVSGVNNHTFLETSEYDYTEIKDENRIESIWSSHYQAIANLNTILQFIDDNESVFNGGTYGVLKGETIALRAYLHFNVLRIFGEAPILDPNSKAIPYYSLLTNEAQPALTVTEVLDRITTDLLEARDLMEESDPYGPNYASIETAGINKALQNREYRMNYYAATATLALVNQYRGDKAEALAYAQEIIGLPGATAPQVDLFSFADMATDPVGVSESIFMLNIAQLDLYSDVYFGENAHLGQRTTWLAINNAIVNSTYNALGTSSIDIRPDVFFGTSRGGERPLSKFFNRNQMPQLKISELYLLAAECEPNLDNALSYFNAFTASRGIEALDGVSRSDLDTFIYNEYKKEFIGEGKLFWFYKRLNFDTIGVGNTVTIDDPSIYTLPIPAKEFEFGNL